jgi:hypothetical protein
MHNESSKSVLYLVSMSCVSKIHPPQTMCGVHWSVKYPCQRIVLPKSVTSIQLAFEYAVLVTVVVHSGTEGNSANITLLMSFSWEVSKRRKSKHASMSSTHGKKTWPQEIHVWLQRIWGSMCDRHSSRTNTNTATPRAGCMLQCCRKHLGPHAYPQATAVPTCTSSTLLMHQDGEYYRQLTAGTYKIHQNQSFSYVNSNINPLVMRISWYILLSGTLLDRLVSSTCKRHKSIRL